MGKQFQRTKEFFTCQRCGTEVAGDGYTNHCTECLTSKHVDINPGDRLATCGGLMSVIDVEYIHGEWVLVHQCDVCGYQRKNRVHPEDNKTYLAQLQKDINSKKS